MGTCRACVGLSSHEISFRQSREDTLKYPVHVSDLPALPVMFSAVFLLLQGDAEPVLLPHSTFPLLTVRKAC